MSSMAVIYSKTLPISAYVLKGVGITTEASTYIFMTIEVFEKFDFTQSSFGQNLLIEDLGNLFYCDLLISLSIGCSTR